MDRKVFLMIFTFMVLMYIDLAQGSCERVTGNCTTPKKYNPKYRCHNDRQCLKGYSCCQHQCYTHKICMKSPINMSKQLAAPLKEPSQHCPEKGHCRQIYHYDYSKKFMCSHDSECPSGYRCCEHCKFSHRICRKGMKAPENPKCVRTEKEYCTNSWLAYLSKCEDSSSCGRHEVCCSSECVTGNVCKRLIVGRCPALEKCRNKHSKRLLRALKCESNFNCRKNEICCQHSCVDHKVCIPLDGR